MESVDALYYVLHIPTQGLNFKSPGNQWVLGDGSKAVPQEGYRTSPLLVPGMAPKHSLRGSLKPRSSLVRAYNHPEVNSMCKEYTMVHSKIICCLMQDGYILWRESLSPDIQARATGGLPPQSHTKEFQAHKRTNSGTAHPKKGRL